MEFRHHHKLDTFSNKIGVSKMMNNIAAWTALEKHELQ